MSSPKRGSRVFHRYHHQAAHHHEDNHRHGDGDISGIYLSPTRRADYSTPMKAAVSNTSAMDIDSTQSDTNSKNRKDEHVFDDLTMGYHSSPIPRSATERNPPEYAVSPASARSFRIISLDGCYEEPVSPLFPESSLTFSLKTTNTWNSIVGNDGYIKRRKSNHNRCQFVLDGSFPSWTVSPSPMYISPTPTYSSPTRSPPGVTNILPSAVPITPPQVYNIGSNEDKHYHHQERQQGRKTPPPTHQEQRRRNRAMPSMQYENQILNRLRQQQQHKAW